MRNWGLPKKGFLGDLNEQTSSKNYCYCCICGYGPNNCSFVSSFSVNLNIDNQLVVINTPKNKYLSVVENNKEFITNEGK